MAGGAFLSYVFQVIHERLSSSYFRDYFDDGLVKIFEITLDSINELLDDAEVKQYQNVDVKNWLDDLKHEVYEVDQLLDVIATDAQPKGKIQHFLSLFVNRGFEARIEALIQKVEFLAEKKDRLGLQASNKDGVTPQIWVDDDCTIYGKENEKEEIIEFLISDSDGDNNQVPIISIVGLIGTGNTTLAQLVYHDPTMMEHVELKAWVHDSESYDLVGLTKSILRSFCSPPKSKDLEILQRQLQHRLAGKKYLLVLDDIWNGNAECWKKLLLPFSHGSSGRKIIVTTHDKEVASIIGSTQLLRLNQLEESDSWSLFVHHAFVGGYL